MRTGLVGAALLVIGAVLAVATGTHVDDLLVLAERIWPVLLFVVSITVVAELAAEAEVFRVVAERLARIGRGRTVALWALVIVFAVASTAFLSLDTAAVLLTPVVVILARHIGVSPLPFALTTVWLANTGSLFLPVSNLTNLLAEHELDGIGAVGFLSLTIVPALVAVLVPVIVLAVVYRRELARPYEPTITVPVGDVVLFRSSVVVLVVLVPALVSGLEVWIPALAAAVALAAVFAVRRRTSLRFSLLPWQLVLFAAGLFLTVDAAQNAGLTSIVAALAGTGNAPADLLRLASVSAAGANVLDNLPAYLAAEPAAGSRERLVAVLIGVNAGPLVTPWASLATLLWHGRLAALGVEISWWRFAGLGLIVAPLTVVASTLAFAVTR
ncbi:arsenic transporter [Labedella phragmitis]|uniref:Arsenic transporter n=1 Tax=Labedella phragmitis TaxID=2498849 RepID=A0A444PTB8_9MICO|nr:SLC13 family permease [Labedella phragmitis]RWZ51126.1 arsenic transporter [Labedella phragmitis]